MRKELVFCTIGTASLIALCGCEPQLAQSDYGTEEAQWARGIEKSYPGYRPPRIAPPAIVDNVSPRLVEAEENQAANVEAVETADTAEVTPIETAPAPAANANEVAPATDVAAPAADPKAAPAAVAPVAAPDAKVGVKGEAKAGDDLEFTVYTVKPGDSLSKIAKEHYGDARKYDVIIKANGITDPSKVRVGMKLQIPKL